MIRAHNRSTVMQYSDRKLPRGLNCAHHVSQELELGKVPRASSALGADASTGGDAFDGSLSSPQPDWLAATSVCASAVIIQHAWSLYMKVAQSVREQGYLTLPCHSHNALLRAQRLNYWCEGGLTSQQVIDEAHQDDCGAPSGVGTCANLRPARQIKSNAASWPSACWEVGPTAGASIRPGTPRWFLYFLHQVIAANHSQYHEPHVFYTTPKFKSATSGMCIIYNIALLTATDYTHFLHFVAVILHDVRCWGCWEVALPLFSIQPAVS